MKKITFVDVVIVLLVICVIAGGFYYLQSKKIIQTADANNAFGFSLCISDVEQNVADEIAVGKVIYDSTKKVELGVIDRIEVKEPYTEIFADTENGTYEMRTVPNRYRVIVHVNTNEASVNADSVYVNNFELYYGKTVYIRSSNFAATAVVWGMDTEEAVQ